MNTLRNYLHYIFLLLSMHVGAQDSIAFFFASQHCRDSVKAKLIHNVNSTIDLPLRNEHAASWTGACWAMELMLYQPNGLKEKIPSHLSQLPSLDAALQRTYLEMIYTLYPNAFQKHVKRILKQIENDKVKAMAWEYVLRSSNTMRWKKHKSLKASKYYPAFSYQRTSNRNDRPELIDFCDTSFLPGETVLCSFQYANRDKPGFLMIRKADGSWMKNDQGEPLRYAQLARSVTNLPFYLTNGNTPQGLYRITGTAVSENLWIGPTTNLQMVMPFESASTTFFGKDTNYASFYRNILGSKLARYAGLFESFTAGSLGRTEIIAHGTTIDPNFYASATYYPNTPSLGCLCSPEWWNENGMRIKSVQHEWMQAYLSLSTKPRYLIVAEVNDPSRF